LGGTGGVKVGVERAGGGGLGGEDRVGEGYWWGGAGGGGKTRRGGGWKKGGWVVLARRRRGGGGSRGNMDERNMLRRGFGEEVIMRAEGLCRWIEGGIKNVKSDEGGVG